MSDVRPKIYFRADGNGNIGLGHVIRSLALAEILSNDYNILFITRKISDAIKDQFLKIGINHYEIDEGLSIIEEAKFLSNQFFKKNDIVVLDGYHFELAYQKEVKKSNCTLICIDDIHKYPFIADAVINHAPGIDPSSYEKSNFTELMLGLDYALLRPPFIELAKKPRETTSVKSVFICFGGADKNNLTFKIAQSIIQSSLGITDIHVVIGSANPHKKSLIQLQQKTSNTILHVLSNLSAQEMCDTMSKCDLAFVPSSSILYETLSAKIPAVSGYFVDNQKEVYQGFLTLGLIEGVGDFNSFEDYELIIHKMINRDHCPIINLQSKYLSGQSREHLVSIFKKMQKYATLCVRTTNINDSNLYLVWANEKEVRENSVNQNEISIESHEKWFNSKLSDENSVLLISEVHSAPVGQVRFDIKDKIAHIGYSIDKDHRGKGYGKLLLKKSILYLLNSSKRTNIDYLQGIVKINNIPSSYVFEKLGFSKLNPRFINGEEYNVFSMDLKQEYALRALKQQNVINE